MAFTYKLVLEDGTPAYSPTLTAAGADTLSTSTSRAGKRARTCWPRRRTQNLIVERSKPSDQVRRHARLNEKSLGECRTSPRDPDNSHPSQPKRTPPKRLV